ncbi:hypothetical protein IV500_13840 [Paeniglutamicibacter antarcticus]|uniref:Uncharacterized protein n=1 Tax=Arthrobacter terrae TaxID=2935737 RepID=A0A931CLI6_9MICC|nr:hypothetical protein [Arthrobacter terrae]MBG0740463.1 hypothetical protein [Arthrobacter terrae]
MRTSSVASALPQAGLPADLSSVPTLDLLASCDRMYRLLDQDFPSPGVCALYQDVAAELDARAGREAVPAGVTNADHS